MTSACHFGKYMYQNCVNIPGGMGLLGACLHWNRACSRSQRSGLDAMFIVPDLARPIKQNREIKIGWPQNGTGAQCPCPSPCMPGRISLCNSMPFYKGTFKGRPYTCVSYCNGAGHRNGPIRFHQQLSGSTSGCTLTLERQGSFLRARRFPLITRRPSSQRRVDGSIVVNNSLCSGLIFSLVRVAFCNRVEHTNSQGAHRGRPNSSDRIATGSDTLTDRSVSINNSCPLPLATL